MYECVGAEGHKRNNSFFVAELGYFKMIKALLLRVMLIGLFSIMVPCGQVEAGPTTLQDKSEPPNSHGKVEPTTKSEDPSASYLEALHVANTFLWAWVRRDPDIGLPLISNRLRAQVNDESWLRQFIQGLSNPHHKAFEITAARHPSSNQYRFLVVLYELASGEPTGFQYKGIMEVIRETGKWRIDHLPRSSDNQE